MTSRPIEILLIEDSDVDALIVKEALSLRQIDNQLHHLKDGQEALDFLAMRSANSLSKQPDLILLDINLPSINGLSILKKIKTNEDTKNCHVIMMTSSFLSQDIDQSMENHAESYITKPIDLDNLINKIIAIPQFSLQICMQQA